MYVNIFLFQRMNKDLDDKITDAVLLGRDRTSNETLTDVKPPIRLDSTLYGAFHTDERSDRMLCSLILTYFVSKSCYLVIALKGLNLKTTYPVVPRHHRQSLPDLIFTSIPVVIQPYLWFSRAPSPIS